MIYRTFDNEMASIVRKNLNMSVPWYIMACYAYYVEDNPIITDEAFDLLARMMLNNWTKISHWQKHLITLGDLKATTYLGKGYPQRTISAIQTLRYNGANNVTTRSQRRRETNARRDSA